MPRKDHIQAVIVSKDLASSKRAARKIARGVTGERFIHDRETSQSFRFRVRNSGRFDKLRTVNTKDGIAVVHGTLKGRGK